MFGTFMGSKRVCMAGAGRVRAGECWESRSERCGQCCSEVGRHWSALSSLLQWGLSALIHFLPRF